MHKKPVANCRTVDNSLIKLLCVTCYYQLRLFKFFPKTILKARNIEFAKTFNFSS